MSPALVFFGRHPTPGKCKSRLARSVGSDDAAASIYDAIVRVVLLRATLSRVDRDETDEEQTRVIFTCAAEDDVAPLPPPTVQSVETAASTHAARASSCARRRG